MRWLFLVGLYSFGGQLLAAEVFYPLYEVRPDSAPSYQLGWTQDGLVKQQSGKASKLLDLNCLKDLEEDPDATLASHETAIKGGEFRCSYEASIKDSPAGMGLNRSCKLVYNTAFFEVICQESYFGGAHPDEGKSYYYLDSRAELVADQKMADLLAAAKPQVADLRKQSETMTKSCATWFAENGNRLSRQELADMLGEPTPRRAGVAKGGAPLIGMSYYLPRVARGNPCDQQTFWVKVDNASVWNDLNIQGKVVRLPSPER